MDNQQIKIRPFTCYFCNKLINNDTEYGHASSCGLVLEPCANKCGSYVPRNMKTIHLKECKNRKSKSITKLSFNDSYDSQNPSTVQTLHYPATNSLGRVKMKPDQFQAPSPTASYNLDVTQMLTKIQNLEQVCKQLSQNVFVLKNKHQEAMQTQHTSKMQAQMQFEKLQYQNQITTESKRTIEMQIENLKQQFATYQKFQNESEIRLLNLQSAYGILQKTNADLKVVREQFHEEQLQNREAINDLHGKLNEFKDYHAQENAVVAALWNDHKLDIDKLVQDTFEMGKILNENKTKQSSLVFDLRTVCQISGETSDKLDIQERVVGEIKKELSQFKLDLQCLEESAKNELSRQVAGVPGRLLWKISDFSVKMENSKENDTVLKSPIFYTHDYGYKIRLEIYLNGIKKWKGRHMIACLHVLKGEYDLLLKWPCQIEGTMVLRDLYNYVNPTNFSKYICAKRHSGDEENEEPQESSTQYIFVPHTTLTKQNFIKEDTMFIEIRINSGNKFQDETAL